MNSMAIVQHGDTREISLEPIPETYKAFWQDSSYLPPTKVCLGYLAAGKLLVWMYVWGIGRHEGKSGAWNRPCWETPTLIPFSNDYSSSFKITP